MLARRIVKPVAHLLRPEEVADYEAEVSEIIRSVGGDIAAASAEHARQAIWARPLTEEEFVAAIEDLVATAILVYREQDIWRAE